MNWRTELIDLVGLVDRIRQSTVDTPHLLPSVLLLQHLHRSVEAEAKDGVSVQEALDSAVKRGCSVVSAAVASDPTDGERRDIQRVMSTLYYMSHALSASTAAWRSMTSLFESSDHPPSDDDLVAGVARFSAPDVEDANRMQQLLLYLLNSAQLKGYRRHGGELYARVMTADGMHDTHAWRRVSDMRDFIYDMTRKEVNYDMWLNLTCARTNVQAAIDHLVSCRDAQLPDLRRDRRVFSFEDGIYFAASDRFVKYGTPAHSEVSSDVIAAKYFHGLRFSEGAEGAEEDGDWYSCIKTPHVQSILDRQDMEEDVCRWLYTLIGRMIYEVGELDGWQVLPFLKGAASSGKSTILTRVCRGLYEPADVGTLSNNIGRKFGLSALAEKLIFIGPEIKSDIALEQVGGFTPRTPRESPLLMPRAPEALLPLTFGALAPEACTLSYVLCPLRPSSRASSAARASRWRQSSRRRRRSSGRSRERWRATRCPGGSTTRGRSTVASCCSSSRRACTTATWTSAARSS
jgi:hypothetical protein